MGYTWKKTKKKKIDGKTVKITKTFTCTGPDMPRPCSVNEEFRCEEGKCLFLKVIDEEQEEVK